MSLVLSRYIDAGLALDDDQREIAARALQPEVADAGLEPSWLPELRRRVDDIAANGDAVLFDCQESHARVRAELANRQR